MKRKLLSIVFCMLVVSVAFPVVPALDNDAYGDQSVLKGDMVGYNITESFVGIIKDLVKDGDNISFTALFGVRGIYSVRDGGGIAVGIGFFKGDHVCWSDNFEFRGILIPHFIFGRCTYRAE